MDRINLNLRIFVTSYLLRATTVQHWRCDGESVADSPGIQRLYAYVVFSKQETTYLENHWRRV
jgi:hypothetical protein